MTDEYPHFRTDLQLQIGEVIWQIMCPMFLVLGTFGNVLSIIVLSRPRFRKWSSTVYLIALSSADLCVLYIGLGRQWLIYTIDTDVRALHPVLCKVHWWLMYCAADSSAWILVAITLERLVSTLCPYKSKQLCSRRVSMVALAIIIPTGMLCNSHLMYGFGRLEIQTGNTTIIVPCAPSTPSYNYFFEKVWNWMDMAKFSVLPFLFLSCGNSCILYRLVASRKKVKSQVVPTTSENAAGRKNATSNMSILLVALNFMFILSTLPVAIYFLGEPYWIPEDIPRYAKIRDPWWALVNFLYYINNSSNFILYCLTGSRFRDSVKSLFLFRKLQNSFTTSGNNTVQTSNNI